MQSSKQTGKHMPLERVESAGKSRPTATTTLGDRGSPPSTAASSRRPSWSSTAGTRKPSSARDVPLLVPEPSSTAKTTPSLRLPVEDQPLLADGRGESNAADIVSSDTSSRPASDKLSDAPRDQSSPPVADGLVPLAGPTINSTKPMNAEPSYKAKRPPPLFSNPPVSGDRAAPPGLKERPILKARSPTAPQPSSPGILPKGLTRLFGRRRSQSATTRRHVVREALSDDPEEYEIFPSPSSMAAPVTPLLAVTPALSSPSIDQSGPTQELSSPTPPAASHREALKALEGFAEGPSPSLAVAEPKAGEIETHATTTTVPPSSRTRELGKSAVEAETDHAETSEGPSGALIPDIRRVSIGSASSYGSEGFSERSTSSRSSSAQNEDAGRKFTGSTYTKLLQPPLVESQAPPVPKLPEISADSPTDPFFQHGRLSPIPISRRPRTADGALAPSPEAKPSPDDSSPSTRSETATADSHSKRAVPNKGICRGCSQIILASQKSVSSADGQLTGRYHKECFVCHTCRSAFLTAEFYVHADRPYCAYHYHELENSLCATCGKGIEGLYMETANVAGRGKEKHHPRCLKCTMCKVQLDHDYFELHGKVYCERDAFRLASIPKALDTTPTRPSPLIREYIRSGDPGLVAGRNFPERRTTRLMTTTMTT